MQFTTIISAAAMAMVVVASPAQVKARNPCSSNQTESCCGPQFAVLGAQCATLAVLPILNAQCSQSSSIACCPNSGIQNGLVNLGSVCVPVSV